MLKKLLSLKNISYFYVICVIAFSNVTASVGGLQTICLGLTAGAFGLLLFLYILNGRFRYKIIGLSLLVLFTLYVILSALISGFEFSLITQLLMLFSTLIFSSIYDRREDYIGLIKSIVVADAIIIVLLILMAGSISNFLMIVSDEELSSLFIQKNILAFSMNIGTIASLYLILFYKQRALWFFFILFILVLFCTGSRRGLFTMFFGLLGLFCFYSKIKHINLIKMIIIVVLSVFFFSLLLKLEFFSSMNDRFMNLVSAINTSAEMSSSDESRFSMIEKGFNMFLENPILGYGAGAFKAKAGFGIYSHNNYIELLVNYGFLGFFIYYSFFFKIVIKSLRYIIRSMDHLAIFIFIFMCVRLISDVGNVSYYDKFLYIMFGFSTSYFKYLRGYEKRII